MLVLRMTFLSHSSGTDRHRVIEQKLPNPNKKNYTSCTLSKNNFLFEIWWQTQRNNPYIFSAASTSSQMPVIPSPYALEQQEQHMCVFPVRTVLMYSALHHSHCLAHLLMMEQRGVCQSDTKSMQLMALGTYLRTKVKTMCKFCRHPKSFTVFLCQEDAKHHTCIQNLHRARTHLKEST